MKLLAGPDDKRTTLFLFCFRLQYELMSLFYHNLCFSGKYQINIYDAWCIIFFCVAAKYLILLNIIFFMQGVIEGFRNRTLINNLGCDVIGWLVPCLYIVCN